MAYLGSCHETATVDEYGDGVEEHVLACWRPDGHRGLHYDEVDEISWRKGKPGDDPPEYDPGEDEAQRIADVFDEAREELDRGEL